MPDFGSQSEGLRRLSAMPSNGNGELRTDVPPGPGGGGGMPVGGGPPGMEAGGGEGPGQGPGGPGIDTPAEQQAVQLIAQGMAMLRQAATLEPSIRWIMDSSLPKLMLEVAKHYGVEEEAKLALQQAQLQKRKADTIRRAGPPPAPSGPPVAPGALV